MNKYLEKIASTPTRRFEQVGRAAVNRLFKNYVPGVTKVPNLLDINRKVLSTSTLKLLHKDPSKDAAFRKGVSTTLTSNVKTDRINKIPPPNLKGEPPFIERSKSWMKKFRS